MPQYLLSIYQPDGDPPPPEVLGPIMERVQAWDARARGAAGRLGLHRRLHPAGHRHRGPGRDGGIVVTDGPFTEGKEHLGGFTVISAPIWTRRWTGRARLAAATTLPVEVRPVADRG